MIETGHARTASPECRPHSGGSLCGSTSHSSRVKFRRRDCATRMDVDRHLDVLTEAGEDRHQSVDREAAEIGFTDAGEVGGGNAGHFLSGARGQPAIFQHADDLGRQKGAQLLAIGLRMAEIAKHVAAAAHDLHIVVHFSISCSRFSRSRIRSISIFGVLIPDFDFF